MDRIRNYLTEEIEYNVLISKKHKTVWATFELFHTSASAVKRRISISVFSSVVVVRKRSTSSKEGLILFFIQY